MYALFDLAYYCCDDYTVVDLETTGLSPTNNEIIELSSVRVRNNEIVERKTQLIKSKNPIPDRVMKLTGIDNSQLANKPNIDSVLPEFQDYVYGEAIVGHNITFDIGFINAELRRLELPRLQNMTVDTMKIAKLLIDTKSYKLQDLRQYFGIPENHAHHSLDDCITTVYVYEKLKQLAKENKNFNKIYVDLNKGENYVHL